MAVKFTAGNFKVVCSLGVENGRATSLSKMAANGTDELAKMDIAFNELQDIAYVLKRGTDAHLMNETSWNDGQLSNEELARRVRKRAAAAGDTKDSALWSEVADRLESVNDIN